MRLCYKQRLMPLRTVLLPDLLPNLRHLQLLQEVARCESASAAARAVHLSQPAISQAIARLERDLGHSIFERGGGRLRLGSAGTVVLARTARALEQLREGLDELARAAPRDGRAGRPAPELRNVTAAQLRALAAVVEQNGFSAAARSTGLAAPSLHRATRQLERLLGVALFERTSFGILPTREAARLARRVRLAQQEIEQARAEMSALEGGERGRTVIGAMPLARSVVLPRTLVEFGATHPGHVVAVVEGTYENLVAALRAGTADLVVGALRDPLPYEDLRQEWLFDDPLAIVVRAGHPLDGGRAPAMRALAKFPWIAPRPGSPLRAQFESLFRRACLEVPPGLIECNALAVARGLLMESDRVMLLSAHQIHFELQAGMLRALPLPGRQVLTRAIGLTLRRDWHPTAAQGRLLEILRARAAAVSSPVVPAAATQRPAAARTRNARGGIPSARLKKRVK